MIGYIADTTVVGDKLSTHKKDHPSGLTVGWEHRSHDIRTEYYLALTQALRLIAVVREQKIAPPHQHKYNQIILEATHAAEVMVPVQPMRFRHE